ncbi:class I SAM-dependent methyltransferase [Thalassospira mesophila]|uniref:SAM-dependent methyltransferase n=1 Tax=Thalassospira mesophila TaxID=1293891 RepID=A0A1Y2L3S9_9PROT|nr:class I SAM-dependent methyltransferase [Thalassospira mesophila]OSQ40475.1 SAM-dependent methyltransferase [Thalassospira mesophila]
MNCRHCNTPLEQTFLDLGFAPPSNAYLTVADLSKPERYYPLQIKVCTECWLVQTEDYAQADELFNQDYAYFSSTSKSWLEHAERYAKAMIEKLDLGSENLVVEIASNDGYLLRNFVAKNIPCLGIEPTASTAIVAEQQGIPILREFFGQALAQKLVADGQQADLIAGNNVYAHVPDINDFTRGLKTLLKPGGTITLEFPHVMRLMEFTQFDTVYHEHFSYLSLYTVKRIFKAAGLRVADVEELSTHGGSLRVYGCHVDDPRPASNAVTDILNEEEKRGLQDIAIYRDFQDRADTVKNDLLAFLLQAKNDGKTVAAYGAAAKGNTLLNYAGVKPDLIPFVCDAAPAKQGKYMPGSHIPIHAPSMLSENRPDYLLILPWNIASEIEHNNMFLAEQGTSFFTAIPEIKFF